METDPKTFSPEQMLLHARWVRRLALQLVGDPNLADDVVQETWVAALENPPRVARASATDERSASVRAWLAQVVRNFVLQRGRSETRRADREHDRSNPDGVDGSAAESDLVEQVDGQRMVVREVLNLSEPTRSTLLLHFFKDLSSAEIARRQGVPAATVRSRLSRGLEQVRRRMDDRHDGNRAAWCAVLTAGLDLSVPPAPQNWSDWNPWTSTGKTILQGTVAMKIGIIGFAVLSSALLTVLGISVLSEKETAQAAILEQVGPPAVQELTAASEVLPEPSSPVAREPEDRMGVDATPAQAVTPKMAPPLTVSAMPPCRLVARFSDAAGHPIAGVNWAAHRQDLGERVPEIVVTSGPDGIAQLDLPMTEDTDEPVMFYSVDGYVSGTKRVVAFPGEEVNVGTITLRPSAMLTGRVVDRDGNPVFGASVFVGGAKLPRQPEGQTRRLGPDGTRGRTLPRELLEERVADDGSFQIAGNSSELVRVWAKADGWRYGWTEPIELHPGQMVFDVEVVLEPLVAEDRIAGVVLDIDGNPLANWFVSYTFNDDSLSMSSGLTTDSNGAFDLIVWRRAPHIFTVSGGDGLEGSASARSVAPGTLDLVLQLSQESEIELIVVDSQDMPIEAFTLETRTMFGDSSSMSRQRECTSDDGHVFLAIPGDEFELVIRLRGYSTLTLGPYQSISVPRAIHCVLESAPGVRGHIVIDGDPVAGARVEVYRVVEPGVAYVVNDFPSRLQPGAQDSTESDTRGAFALFPPTDGVYLVRAVPPADSGRAAVESEPFSVSIAAGHEGLELEPQFGGTLLVVVRPAPGQDAAGVIVGITDGGGDRRTARSDAAGIARFENLRPARWVVTQRESELLYRGGSSATAYADAAFTIPWNCDVRSGATIEHELQLDD